MSGYQWSKLVLVLVALVSQMGVGSCRKQTPQGSAVQDNSARTRGEPNAKTAVGGFVPLPISLPKPQFVGIPSGWHWGGRLEKPLGSNGRPPFLAPVGVVNVALGKTVTGSVEEPNTGNFEMLVDGNKEATDDSEIKLARGLQHVTIDLGTDHEIYAVLIWHYHKRQRVYFDVIVRVSDSHGFIDYTEIFNNDDDNSAGMGTGTDKNYMETYQGKLIDAKGVHGRFVRLYSRGYSSDDQNHYIEVEVYGRPTK
jgi:hypothetical protein